MWHSIDRSTDREERSRFIADRRFKVSTISPTPLSPAVSFQLVSLLVPLVSKSYAAAASSFRCLGDSTTEKVGRNSPVIALAFEVPERGEGEGEDRSFLRPGCLSVALAQLYGEPREKTSASGWPHLAAVCRLSARRLIELNMQTFVDVPRIKRPRYKQMAAPLARRPLTEFHHRIASSIEIDITSFSRKNRYAISFVLKQVCSHANERLNDVRNEERVGDFWGICTWYAPKGSRLFIYL